MQKSSIRQKGIHEYGILDRSYHLDRQTKKAVKYRLKRRTEEVIKIIKKYYSEAPENIIDLGTADGLMLSEIKDSFPSAKCVGIEYSRELVEVNSDTRIIILKGDMNSLQIEDNSFEVAIAAAVIEHLPDPKMMLEEAKRVLKPNGIIIITSPDPFWEHIATMIGHLSPSQHVCLMNIKKIALLLIDVGYEVLEKKKFMISPFGMPLEISVEKLLTRMGLKFMLANQLIAARKKA